jgi:hypothetical protein
MYGWMDVWDVCDVSMYVWMDGCDVCDVWMDVWMDVYMSNVINTASVTCTFWTLMLVVLGVIGTGGCSMEHARLATPARMPIPFLSLVCTPPSRSRIGFRESDHVLCHYCWTNLSLHVNCF